VIKIHYQDNMIAYFPIEIIDNIIFEKDSLHRDILNLNIFNSPKIFLLSKIDSISIYIDKYQPLSIGNQVWMLKNLEVDTYRNGDSIPQVMDSDQWIKLKTGAMCYYSAGLDSIYGKLYNWYAVNDSRGLAPVGWHIPTQAEWIELDNFLGDSNLSGGKLKEIGTSHWNSPNTGATNEIGFTALPGGYRRWMGEFSSAGLIGMWWTSTVYGGYYGGCVYISSFSAILNCQGGGNDREYGLSVRCVKD
jgi:uncharacterized protein (TIGR02145 family)